MATRVLLADDHRLLRDSLRRTLEDARIEVVGEADDGQAAVELATELRPDVVLMDVTMPVLDGIAATRQLRSLVPDVHVVMLTMHDDPDVITRARRAGAIGYLFKDLAVDEVVAAVRRAQNGALVLGTGVAAGPWVEQRVAQVAGTDGDAPVLSEREAQVLQLVADGVSSKEIAARLFLSPKTVRNHLSRIYDKLGVSSRSDAVVAALRAGMVSLD
ncbi:response regulator transcription factor [Nitriliruptoraceae bacterium ZYF776]|nr:response regulator transcription factor [Profundirhabdus halotolerans]